MASLLNEICSGKRKKDDTETKPLCKYGATCYRKNPIHLHEFSHPNSVNNTGVKEVEKDGVSSNKSKKGRTSLESCSNPKPFLFTTVKGIDDRYNNRTLAVSIEDILADNCDCLKESVQFNYMFDVPWLVKKYPATARDKPLLLVHGFTGKEKLGIEGDAMQFKNIDLVHAKLPIPYGTHHTKMMFLLYTTGLKVVIHTANLVKQDWHQKTQGLWISPMFQLKTSSYSEERDSFKRDLILYLSTYKSSKLSSWITIIENHDMTSAKVHIVASVPGRHIGKSAMNKWGHLKMRQLLAEHGPEKSLVSTDWPVIGQFSSIGSLGDESSKWLCAEWLRSLSCCKDDKFVQGLGKTKNVLKLIYPTIENVRHSLEGYSAGGSLPYAVQLAMKQRYLKEHLCQWVATNTGRSLASPHIKTYARVSPDSTSLAWFLLTSANLSKAAWGVYEKDQSQLMIRSYEIGVLFIPEKNHAGIRLYSLENSTTEDCKRFQLPYDTPLTPYSSTDKPWVWDIKYTTEDSHGRFWIPK